MTDTDAELWIYMTQMKCEFLAPREPHWRPNWRPMTSKLIDRIDRLNEYQAKGLPYDAFSIAQAWLAQYMDERSRLGLDTPPTSPPPRSISGDGRSGWGTNEDWGGGGVSTPPEIRAAVSAAAAVTRATQAASQVSSSIAEDWGVPSPPDETDHESAFTTVVLGTQNTYTNVCNVCNNVDITTGPTQLEEANMTYMRKAQAIQNLLRWADRPRQITTSG